MANTNLIACVLLLFFILHHQHLHVEGRKHLRPGLCSKDGEKLSNNVVAHGVGDRGSKDDTHKFHGRKRRIEFEEKAFRPTSPGHSPGVGHSIDN
uniref:Uncharacterized protein n=1 Tax=Cajanus cajan TaxID=3821 RepID=A0A151TIK1_CAJCA|nr:hypothetical protein KK1_013173 [Cajanus cajan]